jgi:thiamine biosynthesis lipoprotein ApbE
MGVEKAIALAQREQLAAVFLLRDDAGITELTTPAFDQLRSG